MSTPSFLSLPGEIRNQIYRNLLVISIPPDSPQPHITICPMILAACRQTHEEASAILYGENVFIANESMLTSMPRLRKWFPPVTSPRCISLIKRYHMHVRLDCDARFNEEDASKYFTGLEGLTVEIFQAQFGSCDYTNLRRLENVRAVKKARVFGSTNAFRDYAAWLQDAMTRPVGEEIAEFESREVIEVLSPAFDPWTLST